MTIIFSQTDKSSNIICLHFGKFQITTVSFRVSYNMLSHKSYALLIFIEYKVAVNKMFDQS
jgi:hypothetical protein